MGTKGEKRPEGWAVAITFCAYALVRPGKALLSLNRKR